MTVRIIGIDLAVTAKHKAIVLDPASNQFIGGQITFRARPAELDRLIARARQGAPEDVQLDAILEATGMAWYPVAVYLTAQGVRVFRVNGQKTKDFRRVLWKHTGSDLIDSRVLARLYQIAPDRLALCPLPNGDLLALQRACRAYARWRDLDVAMQNRMQSIDHWAWGGLKSLVPAHSQNWMRQYWYNPWQVLSTGHDALLTHLTASTSKDIDTSWLLPWLDRAQQMTCLYGSPEMAGYDQLQRTMQRSLQWRETYSLAQSQLTQTLIAPLYHSLFPDCPLTSIHGIGIQSAATYRAFIQDINRFDNVAQFRLWCGIVPRSKQSGSGDAKGLSLTKSGPDLVKAALYINAEVARQWDVQIAALYHRLIVDYGKHHSKAVCACASHLASRIYAVLKQQRPYQLRDLKGNPISVAQSRQLALEFRVPDNIRKRNNKRFRLNSAKQTAKTSTPQPSKRA